MQHSKAASQFNCLEFCFPDIIPENGITMYANDRTQGPACAIAAAAGTVYRNYFAPVTDRQTGEIIQYGQSKILQINNLDEIENILNNTEHRYWKIKNGYSFSDNVTALQQLNTHLLSIDPITFSTYRDAIKVGVHEDVGVTFKTARHEVKSDIEVAMQCPAEHVNTFSDLNDITTDSLFPRTNSQ